GLHLGGPDGPGPHRGGRRGHPRHPAADRAGRPGPSLLRAGGPDPARLGAPGECSGLPGGPAGVRRDGRRRKEFPMSKSTPTDAPASIVEAPPAGAPDRNLAMELVRVTEAAGLAAGRWVGRGQKESADQAAVDAMRLMMDTVAMNGVVVIGEGEKDEAPMLYNGERVGNGQGPQVDVAVDPLEGTRLTALGMPNAIAVVAVAEGGTMFFPGAAVYMDKI